MGIGFGLYSTRVLQPTCFSCYARYKDPGAPSILTAAPEVWGPLGINPVLSILAAIPPRAVRASRLSGP